MMPRASSGSSSAINSVDPLMSANSAVTALRSPSDTGVASDSPGVILTSEEACVSGLDVELSVDGSAHSLQNFEPNGLETPHLRQTSGSGPAHWLQNLAAFAFSLPQAVHFIFRPFLYLPVRRAMPSRL